VVDGALAVLINVADVARLSWHNDISVLGFGHWRPFEIGDFLVEDAPVARRRDVAGEYVRQPEVGIARAGALAEPRAAVGSPMPPLERVAFRELLAGMKHDLFAGEARLDEDERQHILQLIAKTEGAPALIGANTTEHPRSHCLIRQPGVD